MITITNTKTRALLAGLAVLAAALWSEPTAAQSERMELELDEGQIIRLPRPAQNVFIGNPKIADVTVMSPRIIYVFGKKPGGTTFYAIDANERIMVKREIVIGHNLGRLREELDRIMPDGEIQVASVNGGIVLRGEVETERQSEDAKLLAERFLAGDKEKVVNRLRVTMPNQVSIRVRVAEVTKNLLEQLSLSWENFYDGKFLMGVATGNPVLLSTAAGSAALSPPLPDDNTFITRTGTEVDSYYGSDHIGDFDINGVIDVLSEDGLVTILAEPNLTAVSGETASFLAGGEFPIAVTTDDTITIEFKEFGVSLAFTPTVLDDRRISLLVRPEISELSTEGEVTIGNFVVRALFVRRAETTVELGSGQSFAIAGMQFQNSSYVLDKTPGLADIPILGALFSSKRFQRDETELAIIVTPYLVTPSNTQLATPMDRYTRYRQPAKGSEVAVPVARKTVPLRPSVGVAGRPANAAGFIVE